MFENAAESFKNFWDSYGFALLVALSVIFLLICYFGGYHTDIGYDVTLPMTPPKKGKKPSTRPKKKVAKGEAACRRIIERIFNKPFPSVRPDILKNPETGRNLEVDMLNMDLRLGIERNGAQHYHYTPYFHSTPDDFSKQVYRDQLKERLLEENNIRLIIVPYTVTEDDMEKFLRTEIAKYPDLQAQVVG
jgi:hypothetical protein